MRCVFFSQDTLKILKLIVKQEFNLWQDGDGDQQLKFFLADIEWTLQDLVADPTMKGFQKFGFKEVVDKNGFRVFGESWTSLKFQAASAVIIWDVVLSGPS